MPSMSVVVLDVLGEDDLKMPAAKHEESIGALAPHGTSEPLCDGARPRGADRSLDDPDALAGEDGVEGRGDFVSRSRSKNLAAVVRSARSEQTFRACWVTQVRTGLAVTPARRTRRVSYSMKNRTQRRRSKRVSTLKK